MLLSEKKSLNKGKVSSMEKQISQLENVSQGEQKPLNEKKSCSKRKVSQWEKDYSARISIAARKSLLTREKSLNMRKTYPPESFSEVSQREKCVSTGEMFLSKKKFLNRRKVFQQQEKVT